MSTVKNLRCHPELINNFAEASFKNAAKIDCRKKLGHLKLKYFVIKEIILTVLMG